MKRTDATTPAPGNLKSQALSLETQDRLREPVPDAEPLYGLRRLGKDAIAEAERITGLQARPADRRDHYNVRALACLIMRERHPGRYSWSDIALAVYGARDHRRAVEGARRAERLPERSAA